MPNTASAERRARSNIRKHLQNKSVKSRLKTLEKSYEDLLAANKRNDAAVALRKVSSALDKAAKTGVIHRATASRKRSRLTLHMAVAK